MSEVGTIFQVLAPAEKREFVSFLKKRNKRNSTKNIAFLRLLEEGKTKDLDVELYGFPSKAAFHVLQKRVKDALIEFLASKAFGKESSEEMEILKLLLASRILFEQGAVKAAIRTLDKAERKANYIDGHSILNEIFQTKIQYAHLNPKWHLDLLIEAFEANQRLHQRDIHLNMAYATIKSEMNASTRESINEIIKRVFQEFSLKINSDLTYKSLYQLMVITASSAKLQNDFYTVSSYIGDIFNAMQAKGPIPPKYRYYHQNMLYLMAVTEFRNKRFLSSKKLLHDLETIAQQGQKKFSAVFGEKVGVLAALVELYTGGIDHAKNILVKIKRPSLNKDLVLLMCLFLEMKFHEAYTICKGFTKSDDWYERKMGWTWVLKKNVIELLLLIELDKLELVMNRLENFKRKFGKKLVEVGEGRVLTFLKMVEQFYENPVVVKTSEFETHVEHSFEFIGREQEDIFVMSFFAWLRSKMQNKNLYEVTLEMVTL